MKKKPTNSLIRLFIDSRKHWVWIVLFLLLALCSGLIQTTISRLYGKMVDYGIAWQTADMLELVLPIILLLFLDFMRISLNNIINAIGTERIFFDMRMRMYDTLLNGKLSALDNHLRSGDVVARMNKDMYDLCETMAGRYTWFSRVIIMAAVALVNCLLLSWQLSLVYLVLLPISVAVIRKISEPIENQQKEQSARIGKAMTVATDMLYGLMITKSFNLEDEMAGRFAQQSDDAVKLTGEINKALLKLNAVRYVFGILPVIATMLLGLVLVISKIITVGTVIAFIAISTHIRTALDLMGNMASSLRSGSAMAQRIYEILDLPIEDEGEALTIVKDAPAVLMEDLHFGYEGKTNILSGLSLSVNRGEKIGLVGPSGCGKSTVIRLICRLYSHNSGTLYLFGHPIERWSSDSLCKELSIVTQDPVIFDGTIYDNVACGKYDASREEVLAAIDNAYLSEFISTLPNGVDTLVGEFGAKLSGGQKQRIAIARAMLKNASLVLLDEAMSSLDTTSEVEVQKALDRLLEGKMAIIVAHRLTTLRNVDRIIFLENGCVVEQGTFEELIAAKGRFYQMSLGQLGVEQNVKN